MKLMGVGAASVYVGSCNLVGVNRNRPGVTGALETFGDDFLKNFGPFNRTLGDIAPREYSGDQPHETHKILWNKSDYIDSIGGLPAPSEEANVVIVGGGMSGLMSAYFLKDQKPIVLEQAARLGGNSRGESWRGMDYSLATSYIGIPEQGSDIDLFFKEIEFNEYRTHRGGEPVFIDGKKYSDVWTQGTLPENRDQFLKLNQHLTDMMAGRNGLVYPELPVFKDTNLDYIRALDQMTMKQYLEKVLGEPMHPHLEQVIEQYFWSSGASSITQISAAGAVNFFASDFVGIAVCEGGNGAISEAVLRKILPAVSSSNLRASSLVFDVRVVDDSVRVSYIDHQKIPKAIKAKAVVMSCPKFVVKTLIDDLEAERIDVIESLNYNGYLVANLLINRPMKDDFYDLYLLREKAFEQPDLKSRAQTQQATDVVYSSFKNPNPERCILTVFRGFPYPARRELLAADSYPKFRKELEDQIYNEFLPALGLKQTDVVDLRIARWGHPLPQPVVGLIAEGKIDILRRPFKDRVFFAEQDNWMLPSFEVCFYEAMEFAKRAKNLL